MPIGGMARKYTKKYTKEILEPIVARNVSVSGVLRDLGLKQSGSSHAHISNVVKGYALDTSHFTGLSTNSGVTHKGGLEKKSWKEVLVLNRTKDYRETAYRLRRALIDYGRQYICEKCGIHPSWMEEELRLQVDHKNGSWLDNRPENLRFLCPNCHSQTPTHSGNKGGTSVTTNANQFRNRRRRLKVSP